VNSWINDKVLRITLMQPGKPDLLPEVESGTQTGFLLLTSTNATDEFFPDRGADRGNPVASG
jgi:hypothetical protein